MNGADPRAGQHRVGGFRNHRKIDRDAVALLDVAGAQDVGEFADFVVQLTIGDVLRLRGIVALPDDRSLVAALVEMPVDAIPGDVEDAVLEPFDRNMAGREGGVLDLGERLDPADAPGLFAPEALGVVDRARIHFAVFGFIDEGALGPFRRHVVNLLGHRPLHLPRPAHSALAGRLDRWLDYASPSDRRTRRKRLRPWSVGTRPGPIRGLESDVFRVLAKSEINVIGRMAPIPGILIPLITDSGLAMAELTP